MSEVLYHTLWLHFPDIEQRHYPTRKYAEKYVTADFGWLDQDLQGDLKKAPHDARLAERRIALLTFWGGSPDRLSNLPPGVHEAFALPPLDLEQPEIFPDPEPDPEPEPDPDSAPAPDSDPADPTSIFKRWMKSSPELREINTWADGKTTIGQRFAKSLRAWIHQAIVERIEWNESHWRSDSSFPGHLFAAQSSIDIEGAKGGTKRSGAIKLRLSFKSGSDSNPLHFGGPQNCALPACFGRPSTSLDRGSLTAARSTCAW